MTHIHSLNHVALTPWPRVNSPITLPSQPSTDSFHPATLEPLIRAWPPWPDTHTSTPVKVQLELNCCEGLQLLSVIKKHIFLKIHNAQVLSGVHFLAEGLARARFLPLFPHLPNSESSSHRQQKQSALSFFSVAGPA